MTTPRIRSLSFALELTTVLAVGCAAPGSHEAQVASWQRQLRSDSDGRVTRVNEPEKTTKSTVGKTTALVAAGAGLVAGRVALAIVAGLLGAG